MSPVMTDREKAFVRELSALFLEGKGGFASFNIDSLVIDGESISPGEATAIFQMMEDFGVIRIVSRSADGGIDCRITATAVQMAREYEKADIMDLVESTKLTFRKHPLFAWPFMVIVAIVFVATAINQISLAVKGLIEFFK